jgi:hypothetical protein
MGDPNSAVHDKKRNGKSKDPAQHPSKEGPSILALFRKSMLYAPLSRHCANHFVQRRIRVKA